MQEAQAITIRKTLLPISLRWFIYPFVFLFCASVLGYFTYLNQNLNKQMQVNASIQLDLSANLKQVQQIKLKYSQILPLINQIDPNLPGITLSALDIKSGELSDAILLQDYTQALKILPDLKSITEEILTNQTKIASEEITRLTSVIAANLAEIDLLIGNVSVVSQEQLQQIKDETQPIMQRLATARTCQELTVFEIRKRKAEIGEAQKQIVVKLGTKKLVMYENGNQVYEMPISAGRPDHPTRTGDFAILDKLGTVWGYWQIWLPQWMGIYYAGSSENGIHGLPYDRAGNLFWKDSIGKYHVTYGCVMPNDEDMAKLYNWSEVGIPVTIIN